VVKNTAFFVTNYKSGTNITNKLLRRVRRLKKAKKGEKERGENFSLLSPLILFKALLAFFPL